MCPAEVGEAGMAGSPAAVAVFHPGAALGLSCSVAPIIDPTFFLEAAPLKRSSQKRVPFFSRVH